MKETLNPNPDNLDTRPEEQKPEDQEENGAKRWSIYFKSKKLRSYSVKENSSNIVDDQRERRLSDFIGLQNINVSKKLARCRIVPVSSLALLHILSANCTRFKCLKLLPCHINLNP